MAAATVQLLSACRDCDERKSSRDDLVAVEEAATFQMVLLRPFPLLSIIIIICAMLSSTSTVQFIALQEYVCTTNFNPVGTTLHSLTVQIRVQSTNNAVQNKPSPSLSLSLSR